MKRGNLMRKFLVTLVVCLVIIVLGLPFIMGFIAQNRITKFVDHLSVTPNIKYELKNYHRGWFESNADLVVMTTAALGVKSNPVSLIIHEKIKHGPVIFDQNKIRIGLALAKSEFELSSDMRAQLADVIP